MTAPHGGPVPVASEVGAALRDAIIRATGLSGSDLDGALARYEQAELTAEHVAQVERLTGHAMEQATALSYDMLGYDRRTPRPVVSLYLLSGLVAAIGQGMPCSEAFAWLAVLAADPDEDREGRLYGDLRGWQQMTVPARTWQEQVGPLAPWAYAAGLTVKEAAAQAAAGILRTDTLRTLATLRGYRLPATPSLHVSAVAENEPNCRTGGAHWVS